MEKKRTRNRKKVYVRTSEREEVLKREFFPSIEIELASHMRTGLKSHACSTVRSDPFGHTEKSVCLLVCFFPDLSTTNILNNKSVDSSLLFPRRRW